MDETKKITDRDGCFHLLYEPDGVYVELIPHSGNGRELTTDRIREYISRKKLIGFKPQELLRLLAAGSGKLRVADPQEEDICDEEAVITVSEDEMEARLTILPADPGGRALDKKAVNNALESAGVIYGIDMEAVDAALADKRYNTAVTVARGQLPVDGRDGELTFHFRTKFSKAPKITDRDRVDYRTLDLFESVEKGQLLVSRTPAAAGAAGSTVKGRELKPKGSKDVRLPVSSGTVLDDEKLNMYAQTSGRVDYINDRVVVSNCYEIKGDVDLSVGNIDFDGDVTVLGNVTSGMAIKASGSIEVHGTVESACLTAGADILLRRGMQGLDKGVIEAGGAVTALYLERVTVRAEGEIQADTILHSTVESSDSLNMRGKHCSIMGCTVRVQNQVSAKVVGSPSNALTLIEVGVLPHKRTRLKLLETEIPKLEKQMEKLTQMSAYIAQSPDRQSPKKLELERTVIQNKLRTSQLLREYTAERELISGEISNVSRGKVHVSDSIYPGVKICIASLNYVVKTLIQNATFKLADNEITFTTCEI